MDLAQKISDIIEEANMLDRSRASFSTDRVREIMREFATEAKEAVTWIPETQAMVRSGKTRAWLRAQFPDWARQGYARYNQKQQREYLQIIIPMDHESDANRSDAEAAAREMVGR
jgi:hypothetical protein